MARDPDQQVFGMAGGLGLILFAAALVLIPALIPVFLLYQLAVNTGVTNLHTAIVLTLAGLAAWGFWRAGGMLIRSVSQRTAQSVIAVYIGACYTFAFFQRPLTTAPAELDLPWLLLSFGIFSFVGWKAGGALVRKAHRDQMLRLARKEQNAA